VVNAPTKAGPRVGLVLPTLAAAQFVMLLDSSVMNVAIATVAKDVGTTVTGIQTAITMYTLVMAMFMVTGGKLGSMFGRKRIFMIGCIVYGLGSLTTAVAPNLPILILGWSFLEGVGAAMILPAVVALVAANVPVGGRPRAFGLVMAAGGIAYALDIAPWRMHLARCMSTRHDLPCSGPTQRSESWLAGRVNTASGIDRRRCVCSDRASLQRRRRSDSADSGKLRTAKPAQSD
jgi:hypothetical protein